MSVPPLRNVRGERVEVEPLLIGTFVLGYVLVPGFATAPQASSGAGRVTRALLACLVGQVGIVFVHCAGGLVGLLGGIVLISMSRAYPAMESRRNAVWS
jgi:hypothetical protein